ncbi:hypothetical protein VVR12_01765 [Rothia sp. LK2588]|uniref:hypothetical protein n=1 Tax=Rothia sp. LK2588 TaxID=3114369 RepID=UPI0034CF2438
MVIQFGEAVGVNLFPWQQGLIRDLFAYNEQGKWAAAEAGFLVARQNGKGEVLVLYDLAHLFLFPRPDNKRKTILHSAHEFKTAVDGFDRLRGVIEANPELMDRVEHIYTGAGQQQIILKRRRGQNALGDRIKFVARSKSSGRGFSADTLIYDEAQELAVTARDALSYTATTVPNGQELFVGTVPDEAENAFEVFEGVRDRGRSLEGNENTLWAEWSPAGSEDPDVADKLDPAEREGWAKANPTMGYLPGFDESKVLKQFEQDTSAAKESFKRERLSVWPNRRPEEEVRVNDLDMDAWERGLDVKAAHGKPLVLSVRVADNGGYATISAASLLADGRIYVEHKYSAAQTLWAPKKLKALKEEMGADSVVLDEKKCAGILQDLKRERIKYVSIRPGELAGAHSLFAESVAAGTVVHRGQPELTDSLLLAQPRAIGQYGYTWEQSDPTEPVTPAQTVTEALWGVKNFEATAKPKTPSRGIA